MAVYDETEDHQDNVQIHISLTLPVHRSPLFSSFQWSTNYSKPTSETALWFVLQSFVLMVYFEGDGHKNLLVLEKSPKVKEMKQ